MGSVRRSVIRCCGMVAALATLASAMSAQAGSPTRPLQVTPENARFSNYLHDLAGPGAFISIVAGGVVDQVWSKAELSDNLAQRIGQRAAKAAVQVSVRHGLAALMHYSTDYQPCHCSGFGPKVEHALLETFTDRRANGTRALTLPRFAGAYASGFGSLAWDHNHTPSDVVVGTTLSFGFTALFNIARELTGIAH
jgi:hypothetical protein